MGIVKEQSYVRARRWLGGDTKPLVLTDPF